MELYQQVLVSVGTSSLIVGGLGWFLKRYFERAIAHSFEIALRKADGELKVLLTKQQFLTEKQLGIFPEILELTYRLKIVLYEGSQVDSAALWSASLRPLCAQLTEGLYKYRFFLPQETFEKVHQFKHVCQDALLLVDTLTREENITNASLYQHHADTLRKYSQNAASLHSEIVADVQAQMKKYA
jgi:hypothetical protein